MAASDASIPDPIYCGCIGLGGEQGLKVLSVPVRSGKISYITDLKTELFTLLGLPNATSYDIYRVKDQKLLMSKNVRPQLESIKKGTSSFTLSFQDEVQPLKDLELHQHEMLVIFSKEAFKHGMCMFCFLHCACDSNRLPLSSA